MFVVLSSLLSFGFLSMTIYLKVYSRYLITLCHSIFSNYDDVARAGQQVMEEVGVVDILINNAAVVTGRSLLECPDEMIERTLDVNLLGQFWVFS